MAEDCLFIVLCMLLVGVIVLFVDRIPLFFGFLTGLRCQGYLGG